LSGKLQLNKSTSFKTDGLDKAVSRLKAYSWKNCRLCAYFCTL